MTTAKPSALIHLLKPGTNAETFYCGKGIRDLRGDDRAVMHETPAINCPECLRLMKA